MKRIISVILCMVMLLSCTTITAFAAGDMYSVETASSNVKAGDTVEFDVFINDCSGIGSGTDTGIRNFEFKLSIPSGLTFVSGTIDAGFASTTGFNNPAFNPGALKASSFGIAGAGGYTGGKVKVMTFTCTVDSDAVGSLAVSLINAKYTVGTTSNVATVTPASVTIVKAPIASVTASVTDPVAGQPLDFTGTVAPGAPYSITKVEWFEGTNASGTPVTNPATAKAKQFYYARITLTAKSDETFAESLDNTISDIYSVTRNSETKLYLTKAYHETGSLPAASVTAAPTAKSGLEYNGSEQGLLGFVGTANGGTMQYSLNGTTWSDTDPKGKNAGDYTVYYKAKGDSSHSDSAVANIQVTIGKKDISGVTIGTIANQPYTGSAITPDPEVKDGTTTLVKGKDYTVSCTDTYVGTATLTITGKGNYTGTKAANFTITAVNQNPTFTTPKDLVKGGAMLDLRTLVQGAKGEMTFTIAPGTTSATLSGYTLASTGIKGEVKVSVSITAKDVGGDSTPEYNAYTGTNAITVNVIDKTSDTATMKVSQSDITYGGSVSPSVTNKPAGTGEVSYTCEGRDGTSYSSTTAPTNVGKYKVKAKCESSTTIYTAEDTFEILPKSISGMTVTLNNTSLEYNGSAQTVNVTVKDGSTTLIKDTDYTVTSGNSGTNVGSYTVTVTGKGNYTGSVDRTWKITQGTPTYTVPTGLTATFGQKLADITLSAGWSWMDSTQPVGDASTTPKTFKAKFTPADTTNYKTVENIDVSVTVGKKTAPTLEDIKHNLLYTTTSTQVANVGRAGMPEDAGTLTYAKGTESTTGSVTVTSWAVDATTGKVTYTLSGGKANDAVTLPVVIKSTNYADATVNVVIKLIKGSTSSGGGSYYAPVVPDMPMVYWGCTGDAVKTLQEKLNAKGFNSGNVDGIFGAKTYAAVTAFQKANSLGVDGIVGKLTWAKLYDATPVNVTPVTTQPMLRTGSRGDAVRKLQELLNAKGYTCGSVDGIFGSKTYAAVLAFQKANGLGADGIVGPLTWAKLG